MKMAIVKKIVMDNGVPSQDYYFTIDDNKIKIVRDREMLEKACKQLVTAIEHCCDTKLNYTEEATHENKL